MINMSKNNIWTMDDDANQHSCIAQIGQPL